MTVIILFFVNDLDYEFTGEDEDGVFTSVKVQNSTSAAVIVKNKDGDNVSDDISVDMTQGDTDVYITSDENGDINVVQNSLEFSFNKLNIKIHYFRSDGDYTSWDAFTWVDSLDGINLDNRGNTFTTNDDYGAVAEYAVDNEGLAGVRKVGIIIRHPDWSAKDVTEDRFIDLSHADKNGNLDVYLLQNDPTLYYSVDQVDKSGSTDSGDTSSKSVNVRVHYYRYDGDYASWDVWSWIDGVYGGNTAFTKNDDYGTVAEYTIGNVGDAHKIGIIIRHPDWSAKDIDQDRFMDLSHEDQNNNLDIYLLQGDPNIYYTAKQVDKSNKINSATMIGLNTIKFSATAIISDPSMVKLMNDDNTLAANITLSSDLKSSVITTKNNLDFNKKYKVMVDGFKGCNVTLGSAVFNSDEFNNSYYYNDNDLGFTYSKDKTKFKVWAPTADEVSLNLYEEGSGDNLIETIPMTKEDRGVWSVEKDRNLAGTFYTYNITVNGKTNETQDIYSKAVGMNGNRSMVVDLSTTDPEGWQNDKGPNIENQTDAIIYEVHMRDISMDPNSGIQMKGKFLGLTETGTKSAEGEATGIDHLKELGINAIHILPAFDYASVDETKLEENKYNWGYDPKNYMSPEGSYSTDPYSGTLRIDEMKQMVQALHKAGIAVIMDSVFNHTSDYVNSSFNKTVPDYYFRQNEDGTMITNSACGNDTASERAMFRKYMIDSVTYWAKEYHIDGFRYDLMGLHDIDTMNQTRVALDEINPNILMYGEGWNLGDEVTLTDEQKATKTNESKLDDRIASFSDDMRDGLRGHVFTEESGGFVNYNGKWLNDEGEPYTMADIKEQIKFGIVASTQHESINYAQAPYGSQPWAKQPTQTVNYVSVHDNNTIWDKISISQPNASEADKIKMDEMSGFIVLTSQGIVFLHEGQDMLGTKVDPSGTGFVDNSYNSPDSVNQLEWSRKNTYKNVFNYYAGLIKLRNTHPAFRMATTAEIQQNLKFFDTNDSTIGYTISNNANGDTWRNIAVVINGGKEDTEVTLPASNWTVVAEGEKAGTDAIRVISDDKVVVPAGTSMVLADTASFNGSLGDNTGNNGNTGDNNSGSTGNNGNTGDSGNNNSGSNGNTNNGGSTGNSNNSSSSGNSSNHESTAINNNSDKVTNNIGWNNVNGKWYFLDSNGTKKIGWLNDKGTWYYLQPSGEMKIGWLNDSRTWYYLQSSGEMKTGWLNDSGTWYYLQSSGEMKTGWLNDSGTWCYLQSSGEMKTGWLNDSGTWYYLQPSGAMQTGKAVVNGIAYTFNEEGALK